MRYVASTLKTTLSFVPGPYAPKKLPLHWFVVNYVMINTLHVHVKQKRIVQHSDQNINALISIKKF